MRRLAPLLHLTLIMHLGAAPAWAWGKIGHRVIAKFAERHASPDAKAVIAELLEPGESLADASTWADENRLRIHGSGSWHYANVPLDDPWYQDQRAGGGLIVPKLREYQIILRDRSRPVAERRQALRFVVHLVGDLHQPLHLADNDNKGGNALQVRFFRRGTNLHHLWDTLLLEHGHRDEDQWLADLVAMDDPVDRLVAMDGEIEDWATESHLMGRDAYLDSATGRRIEAGAVLGEPYYEANMPRARLQLYRAGARLAWVLTDTLRPE